MYWSSIANSSCRWNQYDAMIKITSTMTFLRSLKKLSADMFIYICSPVLTIVVHLQNKTTKNTQLIEYNCNIFWSSCQTTAIINSILFFSIYIFLQMSVPYLSLLSLYQVGGREGGDGKGEMGERERNREMWSNVKYRDELKYFS